MRSIGTKINISEIKTAARDVSEIKKQIDSLDFNILSICTRLDQKIMRKSYVSSSFKSIHKNFANISGILNNISSFIESSIENYESFHNEIVSNRIGLEHESSSLGFTGKVINGRMVVKVNILTLGSKIELFDLKHRYEESNKLNNHKFEDLSEFINVNKVDSKNIVNKENELGKKIKVWYDIKAIESAVKEKFNSFESNGNLVKKNISLIDYKNNFKNRTHNFAFAEIGDVCNSIGSVMDKIFW